MKDRTVDLRGIPARSQPMMLASVHWALTVDARVRLIPSESVSEVITLPDLLTGAGFDEIRSDPPPGALVARRARSLPDTVGPDMRVLICGLNPSLYAADAGVGYAGPSNRFWKAAIEAGLVTRPGDPGAALRDHRIGMTDLVKRATPRSADLAQDEYVAGAKRVRRLVEWLQPAAVCFVGLEGYRAAVDRGAKAGWQPDPFAGRATYVMPSTSGLNARSRPGDVVEHLRAVLRGPVG